MSRRGSIPYPSDNLCCGMAGDKGYGTDLTSRLYYQVTSYYFVHRPIPTLYQDVRHKGTDHFQRSLLIEKGDGIHEFKGREEFSTPLLRHDRPSGPLDSAYGTVAVDSYDQVVT